LAGTSRQQAKHLISLYSGRSVLPEREIEQKPFVIPGGELQSYHKSYLHNRGFDPEYIEEKYRIKGTGPVGDLKLRLIIPITYEGLEVSYTSRDITDSAPNKYWTCPKNQELIHHKEIFYGLDFIGDTLLIVEGPLDVWRLGDGAIATFGTIYTKDQLLLLIGLQPKQIYIMFDSGKTEAKQALKFKNELESFEIPTRVISLTEGDPGSLSPDKVKKLREEIGL